ncbi:hypothetical protein J8273_0968 [Carpediemonas membranifera]|uniref:Uncharacterized protein n=1 Tax=Carpediemonas membranifera TaxID=201153 RepID=A0A8J6BCQ8_9EUKA|nr:hypothetical protein J8273_0968 [Carpediemonas membranifera]|eukprot:KAG9397472.1 hypothetical protein J8273_0968 [Carpediemonas membranifera]
MFESQLDFEQQKVVPAILKLLQSSAETDKDFAARLCLPVSQGGLGLAMPSVVWAPAYLGAARQLIELKVERPEALIQDALPCIPALAATPKDWPTSYGDVRKLSLESTQKKLVRLLQDNISSQLTVSVDSPNVIRSLLAADPAAMGRNPCDEGAAPMLRNHVGLPAFETGHDVCPLCLARSVNHRSVPCSAEHSLTCPFLREGLGSERHDQIRDTLAKLLRGHPWRVRVEHWLGRGSEWTVDRTKRVKARADLLLTRPGHTEPVVLDVVVSNHASASMRSKKEQYANWNVRVIPVVVRQSGGVGAVHGRGWTDEMRDVLGLDAETVGQIADAVMMACMRQQVHVFHAFMRQADAAHRQAEANGLNH